MFMNLNVNEWKEFTLFDLFTIKGGFFNKKPEHSEEGRIPFLGSTENNNGVTEFYSEIDIRSWNKTGDEDDTLENKLFDGNCIAVTVNGSVCNAFYQSDIFTCSHDITALYLKHYELNPELAMFICTVIMKEKYRWSYGRKPHTLKKFGASVIWLPICYETETSLDGMKIYKLDINGNKIPVIDKKHRYSAEGYIPDFQFMEDYIKSLHSKPITTSVGVGVSSSVSDGCKLKLKVDTWKDFALGRLFDIRKGKRLTADDQEDGENNYIGAIDSNNGVSNHIAQKPIHDGNTISVSYNGSVGEAFYQKEPYWATDDVNAFYPMFDGFNEYIGLFIATVIRQEKYRFSYGRKWTLESMKISEVKLPIRYNDDGKPFIDSSHQYSDEGYVPDFEWMENYIRQMPYSDRIVT